LLEARRLEASILDYEKFKERLSFTRSNIIPRIEKVDPPKAECMRMCGQFVYTCECSSCKSKHFAGSHRCKSRFCLECAHHRSMAYVAKTMEKLKPLLERGYIPHMITFTIRDQENLQDQVEKIKNAWRVFSNGRGTREKFKSRMVGGFRSFEVKIGRNSGLWHAHMHALFLTPPGQFEKDYEWIQPAWKKATGGDGSVELHRIRKKDGQALGILKAVIEVVKYVTSPDKMTISVDDVRFNEMYLFMKGFRAVNTWGLLRGVVKEAEELFEHGFDERVLADFMCSLCGCTEAEFKVYWAEILRKSILFDLNRKRTFTMEGSNPE